METALTALEQKTGRRYSSEAERRLLAWAKQNYPRYTGVVPPENWDPEQESYLADLDDAQYGPVPTATLKDKMAVIQAELGE